MYFQQIIEDNEFSFEKESEFTPVASSPKYVVYLKYLLTIWQFVFKYRVMLSKAFYFSSDGLLHLWGMLFIVVAPQKLDVQYQ